MAVRVRPRRASDADTLLAVLRGVHERDRYPLRAVHLTKDWIVDAIDDAWVAEVDGRMVGHIGVDGQHHLTRFFVDVTARGTGAGTALLSVVEDWARERRIDLGLEVVEHNTDAIALYERRGWVRTDVSPATWVGGDGPWPDAFTYRLGPLAP